MCTKRDVITAVQNMSQAELVNYFCSTSASCLFQCYYLYHISSYIRYVRTLDGYDDFILNLNDKLQRDYSFRKSLRWIDGFDGKYGFKDFIDREAQRIRSKRAEQEMRQQEALRQQRLEEERIKQEAEQHALSLDCPDILIVLRNRYAKYEEINQNFCDQDLLDRYEQRVCAFDETIKNNRKISDYSKMIRDYKFTDPYKSVFKHCCGTALDRQLHKELCDARANITELVVSHRENFQIQNLYHVITYFTALAKEERNPVIAFNLSDFSYALVKAAQGFARATEIVFKGTALGVKNIFKHNLAFCQALVTHPIDDIVKPLAQAGVALGQALYETVNLATHDPAACSEKALALAQNLTNKIIQDPEQALAAVIELLLSFKATSALKLKNIQGLTRFFSQQERVVRCLRDASEIVKRVTVPIKHVVSEAAHLVALGLDHGKTAFKNLINVVREQPEVVAISDIAALKLGPEYYKDAAKLSERIIKICKKRVAINDDPRNIALYPKLKKDLASKEIKSVTKTTKHGLKRLLERGFSSDEIIALKMLPDIVLKQKDGAIVFVKKINESYNIIVEGKDGVITSLKNITKKSFDRLVKNYCWEK